MNQTNLDILTVKNVKYANFYERTKVKLKNIKDNERTDTIRLVVDNIDKRINSISRQDVDFYRQTSKKTILGMIKQAIRTETQMSAKLIELIDEYKRQSVTEKENAEVNYCVTAVKRGRKRKLPLQQTV